jgi:hypothetical protein
MDAFENLILSVPQELWQVFLWVWVGFVVYIIFKKLDRLQTTVWDLESRIDELEANQEDSDLVDEDD